MRSVCPPLRRQGGKASGRSIARATLPGGRGNLQAWTLRVKGNTRTSLTAYARDWTRCFGQGNTPQGDDHGLGGRRIAGVRDVANRNQRVRLGKVCTGAAARDVEGEGDEPPRDARL